jgi:hypothetical protein
MPSRLATCAAAAILAACGGPHAEFNPSIAPAASKPAHARNPGGNYAVLFRFDRRDGAGPRYLLNVNGTFYGTTASGGARNSHCFNSNG